MDKKNDLDNNYLDFFPEMEYFLNAHLSSLLNGYVPPKQDNNSKTLEDKDIEVLDDIFFVEVDKQPKF